MVNIPTSRDIGYVNPRSGRIAPTGPTVSVGAAVAEAGQNLVKAAYDLNDLRAVERKDTLNKQSNDVSTALTRFMDEEERGFLQSRDEASESGIGFTRQYMEGYQKRANEFAKANFEGLSDDDQTRYLNSLLARGNSLYEKANSYETVAKTKYYDRTTNGGLDTLRTQIRGNAAPFEDLKKQGLAAIDAADMPEAWKAERRQMWDADAAESKWRWKFDNDPAGALSELKAPVGSRVGRAYQRLISKGWEPHQAAGIVGNLQAESGASLNSQARNAGDGSDGSDSIGVAQWNGNRAKALKQYAAARGVDWHDFDTQIDFIDHELRTSERAAGENLARSTNAEDAAAAFTGYERPAGWSATNARGAHNWKGRRDAALKIAGEKPSAEDSDYDAISYDRREQLASWGETQYNKQRNEQAANLRGQIDIATANAPIAIQNTGSYSGTLPTPDQFAIAYGPEDGAQRYNEMMAAVNTSQQAYAMQTMNEGDINALLDRSKPTSSGDNAALEAARYDTLSKAAQQTIKAREADPATYTQQAFPHVSQAWQEAAVSGDYQTAMAATAAAQQQLGIRNMQLMPKQVADKAIATFKDQNLAGQERIDAVTGLVFSTRDPAQRRAVFEQLVDAGLPDTTEGAIEAYARGDAGAGRRLMEAAIVDPSKLPGEAPFKPAVIDSEIQSQIMDEGQIGDLVYGLTDGTVENQERAIRDSKLLTNAVNIRVRNGETLEAAVSAAAKDLYGDVKTVTGDGDVKAQIVIPTDADPAPVLDGLAGLVPTVRQQLESTVVVPDEVGTADGGKAVLSAVRQNYIDNVMSEGYFRNAGDGYVFIDPYVGAAVSDKDGKPLIFSADDVANAPVKPVPQPVMNESGAGVSKPRSQQEIDRENYGPMADMLNEPQLQQEPAAPEQEKEKDRVFDPGPIGGGGGW